MSISVSEAQRRYIDYHCYGNRLGTTAKQMGEITQLYQNQITSWQNCMSSDENEYEFDDTQFEKYWEKGVESGKEATGGYDGDKSSFHSAADAAGCVGSVPFAIAAGVGAKVISVSAENATKILGEKAIKKMTEKAVDKAVEKLGKEATEEAIADATKKATADATDKATKKASSKVSAYIAAGIAIATAGLYLATKPNKKDVDAVKALNNPIANAQVELGAQQDHMAEMAEELTTLGEEANEVNEEANETLEEQKAEYDLYLETVTALKEKAESGTPLTEDEKSMYEKYTGKMLEVGNMITETQEETGEIVNDTYDEMDSYQEGYDEAAESMATVEGLTDYAEGFDKATKTACSVECVSQGLNAASAFTAGARLFVGPFWNWIIAGAALLAGGISTKGAVEQGQWAADAAKTVEQRKITQELNTATNDMYNEEIDLYDASMTEVEDLELEVPEEFASEEGPEIPEISESALNATGEEDKPMALGFGLVAANRNKEKNSDDTNKKPKVA